MEGAGHVTVWGIANQWQIWLVSACENLELTLAPSALKIMMNKFDANAFLSQGTPIWSFTGKRTTKIFILVVATIFLF